MISIIDPVTGAPLIGPETIYQTIPLTAQITPLKDISNQPDLGRQGAYPDDGPTVIANIAAQLHSNQDQATTVTATNDHRLRVDTGPSGGLVPVTHSFADTAEPAEATEYSFDLAVLPSVLLGFTGSTMWINYNGPDMPEHVAFWLQGNTSGKVLELGRLAVNYNGSPASSVPFTIVRDWGGGLSIVDFFPGDTSLSLHAITDTVFGTISWTLLCAVE